MPGSSPTMARRCPVMRLKRVDFPTLGLPTMTTVGMALDIKNHDSSVQAGPRYSSSVRLIAKPGTISDLSVPRNSCVWPSRNTQMLCVLGNPDALRLGIHQPNFDAAIGQVPLDLAVHEFGGL